MTSLPPLLGFALTALIIEITPGPNMAYLATLSLTQGRRVGLSAVAGVALGLSIYGVAAALGLAALIDDSRVLYGLLRWAGVAYLFYLAWDAWRDDGDVAPDPAGGRDHRPALAFHRGLLTNLLNPKAALFYVAVLPEFIAAGGSLVAQTLSLSAIYVAIATLIHAGIVMLAAHFQRLLGSPARARLIRRAMAVALAAIAVWFALSTARPA